MNDIHNAQSIPNTQNVPKAPRRIIYPIKTDNIKYQHQYDLLCKLKATLYPDISDRVAQRMVEEEIEKRKKEGKWDWDDPDQGIDDIIYYRAGQIPPKNQTEGCNIY